MNQRNVPGIDNAYLAMDTEEGVEVVWNEVMFSERKNFKLQEVRAVKCTFCVVFSTREHFYAFLLTGRQSCCCQLHRKFSQRSLQSVALMLPPVFDGSLYQKVGDGPVEANIGSSSSATRVKVLGKEQLFVCFSKPG